MKLQILCSGHLVPRCQWCGNCAIDKYNADCPNYNPQGLWVYDVTNDKQVLKEQYVSQMEALRNHQVMGLEAEMGELFSQVDEERERETTDDRWNN